MRENIIRTLNRKTLEAGLQARARELARTLAERNQITIERAADIFDASFLAIERESSARTLEQDFRLLRQVQAALDRLRDGTFGICGRCEEEIAPKRLQERAESSEMPRPRLAQAP